MESSETTEIPRVRGRSQHHKDIFNAAPALSGAALEEHIAATKKAYEQKDPSFSIPSKVQVEQLQEAYNLIFHPQNPEIDFVKAKELLQKLIKQSRTNEIKAEALYLRGILRFNGFGQAVDFKGAIEDFQKILELPEVLEIKHTAQKFKFVAQRMFEIVEAINNSKNYDNALLDVIVLVKEIPEPQIDAILLHRILKMLKAKYPDINLVNTAMLLDLPKIESLIEELVATDQQYARDGHQIIEQALRNKNRKSFFNFFKVPTLAHHVVNTLDILTQATKNADYITLAMVVDAGANLNYVNPQGENPLSIAITMGNTRLVQWLLDHGANPFYSFVSNNLLRTPMVVAYTQQYPNKSEILKLLPHPFLQRGSQTQLETQSEQPSEFPEYLHRSENLELLPPLLIEPISEQVPEAESNQTPYVQKEEAEQAYKAALKPQESLSLKKRKIKKVIPKSDVPSRATKDTRITVTPEEKEKIELQNLTAYQMSKKAINRKMNVFIAAREHDIPALEKLISSGEDINEINRTGDLAETALSIAIKKDDRVLVEWLLNNGANPLILLNKKKATPYSIALSLNNPHSEWIINRLLIAIKGFQAPSQDAQ